MMNGEKVDFAELTLAITLLAGISAVLLKIVEYFSTNIIDLSGSALFSVYLLVFFLLIEILLIVCFLLMRGYLSSLEEKEIGKVEKIATLLHKLVFLVPIFALLYSFLIASYFFITKYWNIPENIDTLFIYVFIILPFILLAYRHSNIEGETKALDLKFLFSLTGIKDFFRRLFRAIIDDFKNPGEIEKFLYDVSLSQFKGILFVVFLFFLLVFGLFLVPTFLLCGSYSIEIIHPADSQTNSVPIAIKDTGIPSGRCYITLYRLDSSNKELFQYEENITLDESVGKSSDSMAGCKKDGIWYLLIDTSDLPTGYYCIHAEVTYNTIKNFDLFKARKCDNEIFYVT